MGTELVDQRGRASAALEEESQHQHRPNRRPASSTSKTPRRRNTNPQSSSPPRQREDGDHNIKDDGVAINIIAEKEKHPTTSLTTPLGTLTSLLQQSHNYKQSTLHLFRISHSLHLHAIDRKKKATEALRLAQAEFEHATTAEEFAEQELQRAEVDKDDASGQYNSLRVDVAKLAKQYKGKRVKLVNLQHNSNWNGRYGTIVKLITEGEDIGRWKVKLDSDWRGKEPDGNYSPFEGGAPQMLSQDRRHVVAKAENLEFIERLRDVDADVPSFSASGRAQEVDGDDGARSSLDEKPRSNAENDEKKEKHHPLDPVEELPEESHHIVTPERGGRRRIYSSSSYKPSSPAQHGNEYEWKRNTLGSQHSPPGYYEPDNQFAHRHAPVIHHPQPHKRQEEPPQHKQLQRIHSHPQQQQEYYSSPRVRKLTPQSSSKMKQLQQQQMCDRNRVSSFSEMVSPEQFEPISFQIETTESFTQRNASLPSSSFFEDDTPGAQNTHSDHHHSYREESNEERSKNSVHSSRAGRQPAGEQLTDQDHVRMAYEMYANSSDQALDASSHQSSNALPTVVVIPVEDEGDKGGPPTCVGVRNAGISHVNGAYYLAPNNEDESPQSNSQINDADIPPLYFRDADPILLPDGRYYDMCILRIDCPDSEDYVIWFLSRVNVDPNCLDVKFSDCYYYCRVQRSVGLHAPPVDGWNIPDVQAQPEAVAFSTAAEELSMNSGDRSVDNQEKLHSSMGSSGLGIVPRTAEENYV